MSGQLLLGILVLGICLLLFIGPFFSVIRTGSFLRGKVVLITGGSRGLGLELARQVCEQGGNVAILARDADELARARTDLTSRGGEAVTIQCDLLDAAQIQSAIQQTIDRFGKIDILINNAGTIEIGPFEHMKIEDFDRAMRLHFWAPFILTMQILPHMRSSGGGRIVNISSIGGKIGIPHLVPYDASKFALAGLSEGLRVELAADNIFVTTVCPGLMRTGSPRNAFFKGRHRAEYAWFSIGDALPLFTMSAERAARQIITACQYGDAELVLTLPAKLGVLFHVLFPELTTDVLTLVNKFLPGPGGIGTARVKGKDSYSSWSPSLLTLLNERAARRNNEMREGN